MTIKKIEATTGATALLFFNFIGASNFIFPF